MYGHFVSPEVAMASGGPFSGVGPVLDTARDLHVVPAFQMALKPDSVIGEGAYNFVYRDKLEAWDGRDIAVKIAKPDRARLGMSQDTIGEAKRMMPVNGSDFFIKLWGVHVGGDGNPDGLIMQLAKEDLWKYFDRQEASAIDPKEVRDFLGDVLHALVVLERHGFVHRDIKQDNILLLWDERLGRRRAVLGDLDFLCGTKLGSQFPCDRPKATLHHLAPEVSRIFFHEDVSDSELIPYEPEHKHDVFSAAMAFLRSDSGRWAEELDLSPVCEYDRELRGIQSSYSSKAAQVLAASGHRIYEVLARMIAPDPEKRCTASECLDLFESSVATAPVPQWDLKFRPGLCSKRVTWRLGQPWIWRGSCNPCAGW